MAIVKHVRRGNDDPNFFAELKTAFEAFFDDVTINENTTPKYMECSVMKDGELMKIFEIPTYASGSYIYKAFYLDGSGQSIYAKPVVNGGPYIWEFYECPNGIMLAEKRNLSNNEAIFRPFIGVTRDNNGNTVIMAPRKETTDDNLYSGNLLQFYAINKNSHYYAASLGLPSIMKPFSSTSQFTVTYSYSPCLVRIPVNDEGAYCPNAYLFMTTTPEIIGQDIRKLILDNEPYITNGAWCIKDV